MAHHPFRSIIDIPAKLEPYTPVSLRDGAVARLARFGLKYIKRGWLARRLFNLAYEQMSIQLGSLVSIDVVDGVNGLYSFGFRIDGVEAEKGE